MTRMLAGGITVGIVVLVGVILVVSRNNPKQSVQSTSVVTPNPSDTAPVAPTNSISISNNAFSLPTLTVKKGSAVTWTNEDATDHTITADQQSPDAPASQAFSLGQSFVFTFQKPGTYSYHCTFHSTMKGTVIVTE
jgi:plastocyanin